MTCEACRRREPNMAARNSPNLRALDRLARELCPDIWAAHQARFLAELSACTCRRVEGADHPT
jgi:hypothetical protein